MPAMYVVGLLCVVFFLLLICGMATTYVCYGNKDEHRMLGIHWGIDDKNISEVVTWEPVARPTNMDVSKYALASCDVSRTESIKRVSTEWNIRMYYPFNGSSYKDPSYYQYFNGASPNTLIVGAEYNLKFVGTLVVTGEQTTSVVTKSLELIPNVTYDDNNNPTLHYFEAYVTSSFPALWETSQKLHLYVSLSSIAVYETQFSSAKALEITNKVLSDNTFDTAQGHGGYGWFERFEIDSSKAVIHT